MTLEQQVKKQVALKEWHDITEEVYEVFGSEVTIYIANNLFETMQFFNRQFAPGSDSAFVSMAHEIDSAFGAPGFPEHMNGIDCIESFIKEGQDECFSIEIFDLPGFNIYVYPLLELRALYVSESDTALQSAGIKI